MAAEYRTTRRVEFADTDMAGIAHFAAFFRYMEEAEHALFRSLDMSIISRQDDQTVLSWPRVRATCDFLGPVRFEDVLDVRVAVGQIGEKSLTVTAEFSRDGRPMARGEMTTVCCLFAQHKGLKSIPIPPEVRSKLSGVEEKK